MKNIVLKRIVRTILAIGIEITKAIISDRIYLFLSVI